jgi:[ribosomal protein S5]-alanine N-acetyltransferase
MNKLPTKIPMLETKNYQLRGISFEDALSLFDFMRDVETMKYITPHPVQTLVDMEEKIKSQLTNFHNKKEIPWVVIQKSTQDIIGLFRLHKVHMWHKKAEMGVVIQRDHQQKGVMTEILAVILNYGFNVLGINRIVGDIFAENKGSKRLLEKYGFHQDGILRQTDFDGERYHDTIVYSMLKSEFFKKIEADYQHKNP